mmetsp:Transcript_11648/g.30491  ORF Transcript_11648/g.30491 Transcript_11648/m.30491 type:complete len:206 (-) Transcript_11648:1696-2313(-)
MCATWWFKTRLDKEIVSSALILTLSLCPYGPPIQKTKAWHPSSPALAISLATSSLLTARPRSSRAISLSPGATDFKTFSPSYCTCTTGEEAFLGLGLMGISCTCVYLRAFANHSSAIAAAALLFPLPTVTILIGTGRTALASGLASFPPFFAQTSNKEPLWEQEMAPMRLAKNRLEPLLSMNRIFCCSHSTTHLRGHVGIAKIEE